MTLFNISKGAMETQCSVQWHPSGCLKSKQNLNEKGKTTFLKDGNTRPLGWLRSVNSSKDRSNKAMFIA